MAFDMLSGFFDNQLERGKVEVSMDQGSNAGLDSEQFKALLRALGASEGYRTAASGYISGSSLKHFDRISSNLSSLGSEDFDGDTALRHVRDAVDYFFTQRPDQIDGFRGDRYRPVDDYVFTPSNHEEWTLLERVRSQGKYSFTDDERRALRCRERQPEILYVSFYKDEAHVFYAGNSLPNESSEQRRVSIEKQYGASLATNCKARLYADSKAVHGLYTASLAGRSEQEVFEAMITQMTVAMRNTDPQQILQAVETVLASTGQSDESMIVKRLQDVAAYDSKTRIMWNVYQVFRQLGFFHPIDEESLALENSDQEFRNFFVREVNTNDSRQRLLFDVAVFLQNRYGDMLHDQPMLESGFMPMSFRFFESMLHNATQSAQFRVVKKSMTYVGHDIKTEYESITGLAFDVRDNEVLMYARAENRFRKISFTQNGVIDNGVVDYTEIGDDAYLFYNRHIA